MNQTTLGGTQLTVSPLCLGTMTFGSQVDQRAAASMLDLCLDRGLNFVDTANVYNGGKSEEALGHILRGRRDRVVLASKVGIKMGDRPDQIGLSRETLLCQVEKSLARLQTDYLDIYYLHQPDGSTPLEETLRAMDELVQQGKVRQVGASNYASWQVCQMLWLAEKNRVRPPVVMQPMYNLLARGVEQEFLPMCGHFGLSVVSYNPLAGGLLTGKHRQGEPAPGTRFERMETYRDRYWHQAHFEAVERLKEAAAGERSSMISLALNWLLHHTRADSVILGASRVEQLEENLKAAEEGPLSEATLAACDAVWETLRGVSPQYNR